MVDTRRVDVIERYAKSGAAATALRAELKRRDELGLDDDPTEQELVDFCARADALNCFGFDAKQTRDGKWIEQGIGSPGRETANHFASIRKYEGQAAWERAVRALWKTNPDRARKIGLPELPRIA